MLYFQWARADLCSPDESDETELRCQLYRTQIAHMSKQMELFEVQKQHLRKEMELLEAKRTLAKWKIINYEKMHPDLVRS